MFGLTTAHRFWLYSPACDLRKSIDGLSGIVRNQLDGDPENGDVYLFINGSRDKLKVLHWTGSGFLLYYKRLERGRYELPVYDKSIGSIELSYTKLAMLVDGLSIKNLVQRKR